MTPPPRVAPTGHIRPDPGASFGRAATGFVVVELGSRFIAHPEFRRLTAGRFRGGSHPNPQYRVPHWAHRTACRHTSFAGYRTHPARDANTSDDSHRGHSVIDFGMDAPGE